MNNLGVVDPLGLPAPVDRFLRGVPRAAWLYFALALVVTVAAPWGSFASGLAASVSLLFVAGLSHGLMVALPGIALLRQASIRTDAPAAFRALVVIAVGTVLLPLGSVIGYRILLSGPDFEGAAQFLSALAVTPGWVVVAVGWLALARALAARHPEPIPTPFAIVAGLAIVAIIGSALARLFSNIEVLGYASISSGELTLRVVESASYVVLAAAWAILTWQFSARLSTDRSPAILAAAAWAVVVALGAGFLVLTGGWLSASLIADITPALNTISTGLVVLPPITMAGAVAFGLLERISARTPGDATAR